MIRVVVSDAALVTAAKTWSQIGALLDEGFTETDLTRRLGFQSRSLLIGKQRILARTAAQVDRLFRIVMKE